MVATFPGPQDAHELVEVIHGAADDANLSEPVAAREFIRVLEERDEAMYELTSKIDATLVAE
ncbi:hypothetical protein FAZ95_00950 [Trinickia violacea]|uniref:Uncharacterized protein n=1 Tax=Trinickia violacea TaxID=2571746 RepID=A0A4P8IJZ6_9BURK|nr:hypothetical protein [Trinickia violacea]QCP47875.1 hypothetical protein FAZ95_00950 [Trinickia violacea]